METFNLSVFFEPDEYELEEYKDEIGGVHSEGLGWNPQGVFCGECSNMSCVGCPHENAEE
jgi:hypothetical protein